MKATIADVVEPRISVRANRQDGVLDYDKDNAYPQRIRNSAKSSGRTLQCIKVLSKHIRGRGFKIPFYKTIVNQFTRLTADKLHRKVVDDWTLYDGFAIHVNYNANAEIVGLTHVPFEELRLEVPDESGRILHILHHTDWARENGRNFDRKKIVKYDVYNPGPDVVDQQAHDAGGWDMYKGQIFWYSRNGFGIYPESRCDAILEDMIADDYAKQFRLNNISTNFLATHILEVNEFTDAKGRKEFRETIKQFQGGKSRSKILVLEKKTTESGFNLKPIEIQKMDGLFEQTEKSILEAIRRNFIVLPVLLGDLEAGKMNTASEIEEAFKYMNSMTEDDRLVFEETFEELFSRWHDQNVNPGGDYSITPLLYNPVNAGVVTPPPAAPANPPA